MLCQTCILEKRIMYTMTDSMQIVWSSNSLQTKYYKLALPINTNVKQFQWSMHKILSPVTAITNPIYCLLHETSRAWNTLPVPIWMGTLNEHLPLRNDNILVSQSVSQCICIQCQNSTKTSQRCQEAKNRCIFSARVKAFCDSSSAHSAGRKLFQVAVGRVQTEFSQTWSSRDLSLGLETSWDPFLQVLVLVLNLRVLALALVLEPQSLGLGLRLGTMETRS